VVAVGYHSIKRAGESSFRANLTLSSKVSVAIVKRQGAATPVTLARAFGRRIGILGESHAALLSALQWSVKELYHIGDELYIFKSKRGGMKVWLLFIITLL
jgi:hypothetical protein